MARFGRTPVSIPQGVTVTAESGKFAVFGPKGTLEKALPRAVSIKVEGDSALVLKKNESKEASALQGTMKSHLTNMIKGVTEGWTRELELVGTGYRAEVQGNTLVLSIGFSHPVRFDAPEGISFAVEKSKIKISGNDKEVVTQTAAKIRAVREPEPYQGKGIKYSDEVVRRKAGKQAAKAGAA